MSLGEMIGLGLTAPALGWLALAYVLVRARRRP